ncbi:terminase small subunit [Acidobacteria bacterium AH-259-O06]|nr:terminase small subunit [Acidobacteria bacterium AH-259-O06]
MGKRPTCKQQHFIAEYIDNGGNGVKAALEAYDTEDYNTANQIAIENLQKPIISREINKLMEKVDLKPEHALRAVKDGLTADKSKTGADHPTRLRAADTTLKLYGAFPKAREVSHQHAHLHLQAEVDKLKGLSYEEIDELEQELMSRDRARKKLLKS